MATCLLLILMQQKYLHIVLSNYGNQTKNYELQTSPHCNLFMRYYSMTQLFYVKAILFLFHNYVFEWHKSAPFCADSFVS